MKGRLVGWAGPVVLIARREVVERLRARSYAVLTALLVIVILGFGVANRVVADDGPGRLSVAVAEPVPDGLAEALVATAGLVDRDGSVTGVDDVAAAREGVRRGDFDVAVLPAEREVVFADEVSTEAAAVVQQAWATSSLFGTLTDAGLDRSTALAALSPPLLDVVSLEGEPTPEVSVLAGTLAAILLFVSLQTFGNYVLVGVIEEKSTAVIELLLARARADQLLAGKVTGIGAAALLQFTIAVVAGLVSLAVSGADIPSDLWSALPMATVWFLGGFALYSTLFAVAGSLVSRQEDAQAAAAPILAALVGAYLLIFTVGSDPESTLAAVLSFVPPVAPLLMPMRMAAGAARPLEVIGALVLLLAATASMWRLAGYVYDQVLLRRGARITWREVGGIVRRAASRAGA